MWRTCLSLGRSAGSPKLASSISHDVSEKTRGRVRNVSTHLVGYVRTFVAANAKRGKIINDATLQDSLQLSRAEILLHFNKARTGRKSNAWFLTQFTMTLLSLLHKCAKYVDNRYNKWDHQYMSSAYNKESSYSPLDLCFAITWAWFHTADKQATRYSLLQLDEYLPT